MVDIKTHRIHLADGRSVRDLDEVENHGDIIAITVMKTMTRAEFEECKLVFQPDQPEKE